MKIRIVLSHPASQLYGEVREAVIAQALVQQGHDVQVYRVHAAPQEKRDRFGNCVTVRYFPADASNVGAHQTVSGKLVEALLEDRPDAILFKGLGYDIVEHALDRLGSYQPRIGFILGGSAVDPSLARADFVMAESEGQIAQIRAAVSSPLPCTILPKYIDWTTADRLYAERQRPDWPTHDIVNVGSFEPRKNQMALRSFFGRYRVALIGSGETHAVVAEAAAGHPDVRLFGALPNAAALGVVAQSRLMVHVSLWEGVPRAAFESLACGTPVVAHRFAIQDTFEGTRAVRLVSAEELAPTVEALLADPPLLSAMSEEGRAYALQRHGPERLAEAVKQILVMAGDG